MWTGKTEIVEINDTIYDGDDEVEVECEVELAENGEHLILSVIDQDGNDRLKSLRSLEESSIITKAVTHARLNGIDWVAGA